MPESASSLWPFFLAVIVTFAILLTAVVAAMLLGRRRVADSHKQYARRLLVVRDQERALLAGEVHSEMSQRIAALSLEVSQWAEDSADSSRIAEAARELDNLGDALRALAHRLHPRSVERLGLGAALRELERELRQKLQFELELQLTGEPMPKGDLGHTLFRIVQEALNNVRTHAGLAAATVRVEADEDEVYVEIEDAGPGFDQSTPRGRGEEGLGLLSMRERAALAGGTLEIVSRPGRGTVIRARVPNRIVANG